MKIEFRPDDHPKAFTVALTGTPDGAVTRLQVAVDFASLDQKTSGRLLLPCHVVQVAESGPAAK